MFILLHTRGNMREERRSEKSIWRKGPLFVLFTNTFGVTQIIALSPSAVLSIQKFCDTSLPPRCTAHATTEYTAWQHAHFVLGSQRRHYPENFIKSGENRKRSLGHPTSFGAPGLQSRIMISVERH